MYEIINGKKYDTETATKIGYRFGGNGRRDHRACEETLYRKKNGEFFINGWGGSRTEYAVRLDGGMCSDGERIRPMSDYDAYQWCKSYLSEDECIRLFGDKIPEKHKLEIIKCEPNLEWDIWYIELSDGSCWIQDEQKRFRGEYRRLDHRINILNVTWDWDNDCFVFINGHPIPWSEHDDEFPELDED